MKKLLLILPALLAFALLSTDAAPTPLILTKRGSGCYAFGVDPAADARKCGITDSSNVPRVAVLNYISGVWENFDLPVFWRLDIDWTTHHVTATPPQSMVPLSLLRLDNPLMFISGSPPTLALVSSAGVTIDVGAGPVTYQGVPLVESISVVGGTIVATPSPSYWPGTPTGSP